MHPRENPGYAHVLFEWTSGRLASSDSTECLERTAIQYRTERMMHWNSAAGDRVNSTSVCAAQLHVVSTHEAVTTRSTASRYEVEWQLPGKYSTE